MNSHQGLQLPDVDPDLLQSLVHMGFSPEASRAALVAEPVDDGGGAALDVHLLERQGRMRERHGSVGVSETCREVSGRRELVVHLLKRRGSVREA